MDEDLEGIQPEVESWYSAELKQLRSANEQVAFYSASQYNANGEDAPNLASEDDGQSGDQAKALLLPKQIHTSLDPFVALPGGVTEYQRLRVQFYSQTLGPGIFGVSDTPRYSPTAATGISTAIYSEVGTAWICILVDETLNVLRGNTGRSPELLRQRARGFRDLNQALRSRHEHYQEALMALTICGLTEFRFGTSRSRDMHTTATDMFLRSKGSLKEALAAAPNIEPFYISGQFGFGRCHFPSLAMFEDTRASWKSGMLNILTRNRPSCNSTLFPPRASEATQRDYRIREAKIIRWAIEAIVTLAPPTMFAAGMQLNLLSELAWTILELATRYDLAVMFFKRIEYLAKGSFVGGSLGDRSVELRAAALATMVSRARRDILGNYSPGELADSDVYITSFHINSLKMFHYLEPDGRYLLITKFSAWLQQKESTAHQPLITEAEVAALDAQITDTWFSIAAT